MKFLIVQQAGPERMKAVYYDGAVKMFDALEKTASKPRLIIISAMTVRSASKSYPAHYASSSNCPSVRLL